MKRKLVVVIMFMLLLFGSTVSARTWIVGEVVYKGIDSSGCPVTVTTLEKEGAYLWNCKTFGPFAILVVMFSDDKETLWVMDARPDGKTWLLKSVGDITMDCDWRIDNGQVINKNTFPFGYKLINAVRAHYISMSVTGEII